MFFMNAFCCLKTLKRTNFHLHLFQNMTSDVFFHSIDILLLKFCLHRLIGPRTSYHSITIHKYFGTDIYALKVHVLLLQKPVRVVVQMMVAVPLGAHHDVVVCNVDLQMVGRVVVCGVDLRMVGRMVVCGVDLQMAGRMVAFGVGLRMAGRAWWRLVLASRWWAVWWRLMLASGWWAVLAVVVGLRMASRTAVVAGLRMAGRTAVVVILLEWRTKWWLRLARYILLKLLWSILRAIRIFC